MIGIIWRLAVAIGLTGLLVINSLGAASDLILQKHHRHILKLDYLDIPEQNVAVEEAKRWLDISSSFAPWSFQPQEDKLIFIIWLAKVGLDISPNWGELNDTFLAAVHRAPTRAELYINFVNLYLANPEVLITDCQDRNYWASLLTLAKRLNPTMAYTEFQWGKLLYKKLPITVAPPEEIVSEICKHIGNGLALQGNKINWDTFRDSYSICFGLTRKFKLLEPLLPVNSDGWRMLGAYLSDGNNSFINEVAPFIEQRILENKLTAEDCLALAKGLSDKSLTEAIRFMHICMQLHPEYSPGWTWLIQNIGRASTLINKCQLTAITSLAMSKGNLNSKDFAGIGTLLCKYKMYTAASLALNEGIKISKKNDYILEALAGCLVDSRRTHEAIEMLEAVLAHHPKTVWAWLYLGKLQLDNGQTLNGEQSLNRVLKLEPNNRTAIQYLKKHGIY